MRPPTSLTLSPSLKIGLVVTMKMVIMTMMTIAILIMMISDGYEGEDEKEHNDKGGFDQVVIVTTGLCWSSNVGADTTCLDL